MNYIQEYFDLFNKEDEANQYVKDLLLHRLLYLKNILVYFESFNRHLYRYNGLVILEKIFLMTLTNTKYEMRLFLECCRQGLHKQIKLLLKESDSRNANRSIKMTDFSSYGETIISIVCERGYIDIVNLVLEDPRFDIYIRDSDAIRCASAFGHYNIVKLLLCDKRFDPCYDDDGALRCAINSGYLNITRLLLSDERVDPGDFIELAAANGHIDIVKFLLDDPRVDPSENENKAIRNAFKNGHKDIIELLLKDKRVY